jgi:hypothetical protein
MPIALKHAAQQARLIAESSLPPKSTIGFGYSRLSIPCNPHEMLGGSYRTQPSDLYFRLARQQDFRFFGGRNGRRLDIPEFGATAYRRAQERGSSLSVGGNPAEPARFAGCFGKNGQRVARPSPLGAQRKVGQMCRQVASHATARFRPHII